MGERLLQITKQTGIFIVCAQMLLHFKAAECYEKYIRLLISIMVLAQVIVAVSAVFGKEGGLFFDGRGDFYRGRLAESMEEADMEKLEAILEKMTMAEVQARVDEMRREAAAEQAGAEPQQSGTTQQPAAGGQQGENQPLENGSGADRGQPVEEIDIEIDRIEVSTGD